MCKVFEQQQAEVVPLHMAGVLELVNHYVPDGGTDFLEDERGVPFVHQVVKQGVGVRQQEAVVFPVQRPYFLVDVVEQLQLVEVLEREAATVDSAQFLPAQTFGIWLQRYLGISQQRHQDAFRQTDDVVLPFGGLCRPMAGIFQAVSQGVVQHILVRQLAVTQFAEVAADSFRPSLQVVGSKGMSFQFPFKLVVESLHLFQRVGFHLAQHVPIEPQHVGRPQTFPQFFATLHVAFVEDVPSEALDFVRYVPALVFADAFVNVFQQPRQYGRGRGEFFDEAVHGIAQHFGVVQFDVQVGA